MRIKWWPKNEAEGVAIVAAIGVVSAPILFAYGDAIRHLCDLAGFDPTASSVLAVLAYYPILLAMLSLE